MKIPSFPFSGIAAVYRWPILFMFLGLFASTNLRPALVGAHWDSPIYLYLAKQYADTNFLADIQLCAKEYAVTMDRLSSLKTPYCFTSYSRLGHIVILGELISIFGNTELAIQWASMLFYVMLALAIGLLGLTTYYLDKLLSQESPHSNLNFGIFVSTLLYLLSDLFSYFGNSLVSDIPSFLSISAASTALAKGLLIRSPLLLIFSGLLNFLAYSVRLESVMIYILLIAALAYTSFIHARNTTYWIGFLIAGTSSVFAYLIYTIFLFPLTYPLVYLDHAKQVNTTWFSANSDYGYEFFIRAGGPLWIGGLIWAGIRKNTVLSRLSLLWLGLITITWAPFLFEKGPTQSRHYILVAMPLMILSSLGWAKFRNTGESSHLSRRCLWIVLSLTCTIVILSHSHNYLWARKLPGLWRLDTVRNHWLISPSLFEQPTYHITEAKQISKILYSDLVPTIVLRSHRLPLEDMLYLIRFFGPPFNRDRNFVKDGATLSPERIVECRDLRSIPPDEPVLYTEELSEGCRSTLRSERVRMLHLHYRHDNLPDGLPQGEHQILKTDHYIISQVK